MTTQREGDERVSTDWKSMNHEIPNGYEKYVTILAESCSAKNELILITRFQKIIRLIYDKEVQALTARCEKLEKEAQQRLLKFGGPGIGQVYGLANCEFCKKLNNDYFLIGKSQLCLECFETFPKSKEAIEAVEGK